MSIDDLLLQISDDMMLPSITAAEISKLRIGESIVMHDKGKGVLFLDSYRRYFAPDQPWTTMASQIVDLLSVAHSKSLEDLIVQQKEHCLVMERPCSSTFLTGSTHDSGVVLAQFYSVAKSTCWRQVPRTMVEEDFVQNGSFIEAVQYWDAAPSLTKTWAWQRVCTEVILFSMSGCLRPASCFTDIVVANLGVERLPDYFLDDFDQGVHSEYFVDFLSDSSVQSDSEIDSESTSGNTVYRSPSPADNSFALDSPPPTSQRKESTSSASGSPLSITLDDVPLKDHTEDNETSLPTTSTDLSSAVDDIKSFLTQSIADSENNILHKIQAIHNDVNTLSVHISEYRKGVQTFGASVNTNNVATQRKIDAQQAKIDDLDTQVAAIRNDQLEFQTRIAADILILSTQISDIADFIRSGDAKKGEVGSSSRRPPIRVERRPMPTPQPSPDVQGSGATQLTGGGSAVRTPTFPPTVGTFAERVEMAQRHILESGQVISIEEAAERVIEADRWESDRLERERARERRERRLRRRGL
ncbi:hypothetical protein F511_37002 [Dorcoceras hygrometricum]|uniref:Uncharacterized protein n=1 Tax=Dorcoceras hygrometricum TaxID=472368 RepID=A0A2Z7AT47_9LAMI|nr:hypothetical protein F511_37002 [Dorcoceras hygrometricum]